MSPARSRYRETVHLLTFIILHALELTPGLTVAELSKQTGAAEKEILQRLESLSRKGLVESEGGVWSLRSPAKA